MAVHTQSLLASERQEKVRGNTTKKVTITEALFEIGGKKKIKEKIKLLEEKCHPGTEEHLEFRRNEGNEIQMLRTCMGRKHDVKQRVNRMREHCSSCHVKLTQLIKQQNHPEHCALMTFA